MPVMIWVGDASRPLPSVFGIGIEWAELAADLGTARAGGEKVSAECVVGEDGDKGLFGGMILRFLVVRGVIDVANEEEELEIGEERGDR